MKSRKSCLEPYLDPVAPFTGAWIEIPTTWPPRTTTLVAPFTGAWIEIFACCAHLASDVGSLPSRERGLKCVQPVQGARPIGSLPSRERGLKCHPQPGGGRARPSLPSRERGLKCRLGCWWWSCLLVAPFTGAWIEIHCMILCRMSLLVAPFTGAWIEIHRSRRPHGHDNVAPFTGAWIEICPTRPSDP